MIRSVTVACAAALAIPALASATPDAIKASYDVFRNGMQVGAVQETFARDGNYYRIVSEVDPAGIAALFRGKEKLSSSGRITHAGLRPEQFTAERSDDPAKNLNTMFDWRARLLRMAFDGRERTAPLAGGTQDRVSVMYQFVFLKARDVGELAFQMTNGRKITSYRYHLADREQLATSLGDIPTLHLVKQREAGDNNVEVWLARDRHLFPVKLLIVENDGTRFEQAITQLEFK